MTRHHYRNLSSIYVPPIENDELFVTRSDPIAHATLRFRLREGQEYVKVREKSWHMLQHWFEGGPAVAEMYVAGMHVVSPAIQLTIRRTSNQLEGKLFISNQVSQHICIKHSLCFRHFKCTSTNCKLLRTN